MILRTGPLSFELDQTERNSQMFQSSFLRFVLPLCLFALAVLVSGCGSPASNEQANVARAVPSATTAQSGNTPASAKPKLDLNTASETDLLSIPGMTNRMVHEFQEYRPYKSIQQFRREMAKYVSAAVIADYEKYVYVPISPNDSDAATLQQIPGLDATEAEALIAGRPFASREDFLAKLSAKLTPEELAVAKTYTR
jgi:DNA uptake protein ComE-like DNA-binding protein